nr:hypothetical protein [Candidatus Anoxychlamydiales bacterium]
DSSGRYVYAVWDRSNGTNNIIQVAISSDFAQTWADPTTAPTGTTTPNLSVLGESAFAPQIATDSTGRYVYVVWDRSNGTNTIIQVAISSDFGQTWSGPTTTPTGTTTPNLSDPGGNAVDPQIATDSSGRYVYAVWDRSNGTNNIIQVVISSDFGQTWSDPTTTPTGTTTPNLSVSGENAGDHQITTDSSGRYVYAVWYRYDGTNQIIQVAISSDFGQTWTGPTTTPTGTAPNLSVSGESAYIPQIVTDSSGRYVYAVWYRDDDVNYIIQVAISSDFGQTWTGPTTTPTGIAPNLSVSGQDAENPQIATDSSGRYVYAVWYRYDGANDAIIQVAISSDFGQTWSDSTTTPTGIAPNLSVSGEDAIEPQIATDSTGRYVYVVWYRSNGTNNIIQVAKGFKTFFPIKNSTIKRG